MPGKRNRDTFNVNDRDGRYITKTIKTAFLKEVGLCRIPPLQIQTNRYQGYDLQTPKKIKIERSVAIPDRVERSTGFYEAYRSAILYFIFFLDHLLMKLYQMRKHYQKFVFALLFRHRSKYMFLKY